MQKPRILKTESDAFAPLHPALTVLEASMHELVAIFDSAARLAIAVDSSFATVSPTNWATRIEQARNSAEQLQRIRMEYGERSLCFLSVLLRYEGERLRLKSSQEKLHQAIVDAIIARDALGWAASEVWLKPIFEARIILAVQLHSENLVGPRSVTFRDAFVSNLLAWQVSAFKKMVEDRKSSGGQKRQAGKPVLVPFIPMRGQQHPSSARLVAVVEACRQSLHEANSESRPSGSAGSVGSYERQYADVLLGFLKASGLDDAHSAAGIEARVAEQFKLRHEFEMARQRKIVCARRYLQQLREVMEVFNDSVKEVEAIICMAPGLLFAEEKRVTQAAMINNLLATDALLRSFSQSAASVNELLRNVGQYDVCQHAVRARYNTLREGTEPGIRRRRAEIVSERSRASEAPDTHNQGYDRND